jgi:hypothetical protein
MQAYSDISQVRFQITTLKRVTRIFFFAQIITEILDIFYRPKVLGVETRRFGNWIFPSSGEWVGEKTPHQFARWLRLAVSKAPLFTCGLKQNQFPKRRVSTPKNSGRWKRVQNPSNSVCYMPSSEPFKIYETYGSLVHTEVMFTL